MPIGRPKEDPRVALTVRVTEDFKERLLEAVRQNKSDPRRNTPGKMIESKWPKPKKNKNED